MYITTKQRESNILEQIQTRNIIDDLFAGLEINPEVIHSPVENNREMYRYKTKWIRDVDVRTNAVGGTAMTNFVSYINTLYTKYNNCEDMSEHYIHFEIPKKTHGTRPIDAPNEELKKDLKEISNRLINDLKLNPHDCAWAYTQGRDVVRAMHEHTSNESRWFLKIDLHNFFGSCTPSFIVNRLLHLYPFAHYNNMSDTICTCLGQLADLACLNGSLPQGTPLSPIITNLIMVEFDYNLNKMIYKATKDNNLFKQKYIYTRYADDIIISAKNKFDYQVIVDIIKNLLEGTPLEINEEKTRFGSNAGRNWNLGVMCNKDNKITVGYKRKHQLKSIVHNYFNDRGTMNSWNLSDLQWLLGQFSWLNNVEPDYYNGFIEYIKNKYNKDIIDCIKYDIKHA